MNIEEITNSYPLNNKTICLNMIVKDESHIIEKTLQNICDHINFSYYVICDTGSKDNTIQIIKEFFVKKGINGEVLEDEWFNFEHNRNLALIYAKDKADYSFIFDADDYIHGDLGSLVLPSNLTDDGYTFMFKGSGTCYHRTLLVNNHKKWEWIGVVHEVITCKENPHKITEINGNYFIESGRIGARNKDPLKYQKDALLLEEAISNPNTDQSLIGRYAFYCGQSWKDFNNYQKAIFWYKKVVNELNNWYEEKYYACLKIGELLTLTNKEEEALYWYLLSSKFNKQRLEGITQVGHILLKNKMYNYASKCLEDSWHNCDLKYPLRDFLFANENTYLYEYLSLTARAAFYSNNFDLCKKSFFKLIERYNDLDNKQISTELINLQFYYEHLSEQEKYVLYPIIEKCIYRIKNEYDCINSQRILQNCDKYFTDLTCKISDSNIFKEIEEKIFSVKEELLLKKTHTKRKNNGYNVILTMTTCKRYDLFKKTMDSILYFWEDINKIDKFVIIDDDSSEEDKNLMIQNYPFIDLFEKDEEQKGHRTSMNIIWNLLNTVKPKYWIHLEDDWLFFKRDSYVEKAMESLENLENKNIHQILYNKGYGEIISDLSVPIGEKVFEHKKGNILVHIQNQKLPISSCSYWWHYSFRPSMIRTEKILELGDYNSENIFFELDYAKKYVSAGYKSAYYDDITCLHIGRLSGCRADNNISNAYNLNNIEQFNNNTQNNNSIDKVSFESSVHTKINISEFVSSDEIKYINFNEEYIFVKGYDIIGNDLFYNNNKNNQFLITLSNTNNDCIGFNTLGFFKHKISKLEKSPYFSKNDGIYIKKKYLNFDI